MTTPVSGGAPASAPSTSSSAPAASSAPAPSSTPSPSMSEKTGPTGGPAPTGTSGSSGEPTSNTAATQEAVRQAAEDARKFKLKINGQEREYSEAEVIRRAQLAEAAQTKFEEAAQMRKQVESLVQALKADPMSVLTAPELGINFRELAENYLAKELQREMMPKEQRELEELREWKKQQTEAQEAAKKQQMTAAQQAEFQRVQAAAAKKYDTEISEVLQKSNLPKNAESVKRIASMLKSALEKGVELDVQTVVDFVRDGYTSELQTMTKDLDGEPLVKFLGEDIIKKLRKYDLAQIKAKMAGQQVQPPQSQPEPHTSAPKEEKKFLKPHEWLEEARKRAGV
jgi:hypothetical protein